MGKIHGKTLVWKFCGGVKRKFHRILLVCSRSEKNDNCVYNYYTMTDMERMIPVLYEKKKNVVVVLHVMLSARLLLSA